MIGLIILLFLGYLLGSCMTGVWVSRILSLADPRLAGSLNPGMTNVWRLSGKKAAFLTFLGDFLKGCLPLCILNMVVGDPVLSILMGTAILLGHSYPLFSGLSGGGKGVATVFGFVVAMAPYAACVLLVVWLLILFFGRYVSLASMGAALALGCIAYGYDFPIVEQVGFDLWAVWIIGRHKSNIRRLLEGQEPSFFVKK